MTRTDTFFGRHADQFLKLEGILRESELEAHNALLVGAGLEPSAIDGTPVAYEPFELALVLQGTGKPWRLTVADISDKVCDSAARQEMMDYDDYIPQLAEQERARYIQIMAAGLGESRKFTVRGANAEEDRTAYRAKIPAAIKDRITTVNRDISNPGHWPETEKYGVVVTYFVMRWLYVEQRKKARQVIKRALEPGGVLLLGDRHGLGIKEGMRLPMLTEPEFENRGKFTLSQAIYQKPKTAVYARANA